jgi:hypothetical protein
LNDKDRTINRKIDVELNPVEIEANNSITIKLSQVGSEREYSKLSEFAKFEAKSYENLLKQKEKKQATV